MGRSEAFVQQPVMRQECITWARAAGGAFLNGDQHFMLRASRRIRSVSKGLAARIGDGGP